MGALTENPYGEEPPELNPECCGIWQDDGHGNPLCCSRPVPDRKSQELYYLWQTAQQSVGNWIILVEYKK